MVEMASASVLRLPRERIEDIPLLVEALIGEFNQEHHRTVLGIEPECLDVLKAQRWDGNVRELRNAIEYAVIVSRAPMLMVRDLPAEYVAHRSAPTPSRFFPVRP